MAIFKKGDNYYIDYYFEGKRKREKVGPSYKQAEDALKARLGEIAQGKFQLKKTKTSPLFKDFADEYLEWSMSNKKSWTSDRTSLNHLVPFFGTLRMKQMSSFLVEQYKLERKKAIIRGRPIKPATINRELACLRKMFNLAKKWGRVDNTPMTEVRFFREEIDSPRYLSLDEMDLLLEGASEHLRPILITALNTGMRLGEILGLHWDDIDFDHNIITVRHTKNKEYRKIPMNSRLTKTLGGIKINGNCGGYVFSHEDGQPYSSVKTAFNNLRNKLKRRGVPHFRFHDLRHTFASYLVMSGADIVVVKELLGHKSLSMTMRYSHLSQEHKRTAVENLDRHYMDTKADSIKSAIA